MRKISGYTNFIDFTKLFHLLHTWHKQIKHNPNQNRVFGIIHTTKALLRSHRPGSAVQQAGLMAQVGQCTIWTLIHSYLATPWKLHYPRSVCATSRSLQIRKDNKQIYSTFDETTHYICEIVSKRWKWALESIDRSVTVATATAGFILCC